jgi:HEPN domain-containing protein
VTSVDEWVEKAEADYMGAVDMNRRRKYPLPDLVCFHCQQSAEKYRKAFLIAHGATPPHIHDLEDLLAECAIYDLSLAALHPLVVELDPYSVRFRYPGASTTVAEADSALRSLRRLRRTLRKRLGV